MLEQPKKTRKDMGCAKQGTGKKDGEQRRYFRIYDVHMFRYY